MGIDLSMYSRLPQPAALQSQYDIEAGAEAIKGARNTSRLADLTYGEKQREISDQSEVRNALMGANGDYQASRTALYNKGLYKPALELDKAEQARLKSASDVAHQTAQNGKLNADADTSKYDLDAKKRDKAISDIASYGTPDQAHASLDASFAKGEIPADKYQALKASVPPDAAAFQAWQLKLLRALMTPKEQMQYSTPDANTTANNTTSLATNKLTTDTSRSNNAATIAQSERASIRSDVRARESNSVAMSKPFEVTGPDGNPALVQQDKQGNIKPVTGYSAKTVADKPLNDAQSKALLFGSRMRESDKILGTLAAEGTDSSVPGSRAYGIGGVINAFSSDNQQMLDQAKRDFVNATLRRESGAVISDGEFANADKQYFPQIGDSAKVKTQKAANRKLALKGVLMEVPEKKRDSLQPDAPSATKSGATVSNW